ncbi:MAG: hypothetical protein Ct9H90mP22_5640 [Gammaproteobacteria bacterium]|nr:MAG: hypothetical protein Ct9H90mP22_5640 [Gammaproteobacteria bacterium]
MPKAKDKGFVDLHSIHSNWLMAIKFMKMISMTRVIILEILRAFLNKLKNLN